MRDKNKRVSERIGLTPEQKAIVTSARTSGGTPVVRLDDEQCAYLVALIATDVGLGKAIGLGGTGLPDFFETKDLDSLRLADVDFLDAYEKLAGLDGSTATYFHCLAALHKRRLKYQRILQEQPIPSLAQVGPRGLLQYGSLSAKALTSLLFWRKWLYDIDGRAGQETGLTFEPIVTASVGGRAYSHTNSPVRRRDNPAKGRQVDCLLDNTAYEVKLRVTIAASGQGRWDEEKDFPADCKASGYVPVLLVFDDTQADKLDELCKIFEREGGRVYIGEIAWEHLEELANPTMRVFLRKYIRTPLDDLLANVPNRSALPPISFTLAKGVLTITVAGESQSIPRAAGAEQEPEAGADPIPDENEQLSVDL